MSRKNLPSFGAVRADVDFVPDLKALHRWNTGVRPARALTQMQARAGIVIDIFEVIGEDWWTGGGVTAKKISSELKPGGDVTVNINSPGGDFFEGLAIYEMLRAHQGRVDVNIMGLAASAATIVAEAGDTIRIGKASSFMIHNTWGVVAGDRNIMAKAVEIFGGFDTQLAGLYADRTGKTRDDAAALMDSETWMNGEQAVAEKFADELLPADSMVEDGDAVEDMQARRERNMIEAALALQGESRTSRRATMRNFLKNSGTPRAAETEAMPRAGLASIAASLARLKETIKR